jgi:hypothetical protein
MNPDDHIRAVPVPGTDLYEVWTSPLMERALTRALTDERMDQLVLALDGTDDPDEQEMILRELARRMGEIALREAD